MAKVCTKCRIEKPLSEFATQSARKDGKTAQCKTCIAAAKKIFYERNREKIKAKRQKSYRENPEKYEAYKNSDSHFLSYNKSNAKKRGYDWLLSDEEALELHYQPCHYCGMKAPGGIDRKHNDEHYTFENCVPCCKICNRAKNSMTYQSFIDWINQIKIGD